MKKLLLLLLALLFYYNSFAQDQFTYTKEGLTDFVVVNVDDLSRIDVYNKTINWVKETYKNPDLVIKTSIDGDKVRIAGFKEHLICTRALGIPTCYGGTYTISISSKDGKYKFDPSSVTYRLPPTPYSYGVDQNFYLNDGSPYYKKNGKIRTSWKTVPENIAQFFNDLNLNLKNYILKNHTNKIQEDW